MSGIGEAVGIIACVAAVISAYKDGSRVVQGIKEKRRRAKAPPPTEYLELSLDQGAQDVENARRAGVQRFGDDFGRGDGVLSSELLSYWH